MIKKYNEYIKEEFNWRNLNPLEILSCYNNRLTNLNGLENLINLEYLYCWYNNFSNEYKNYLKEYCKKKKIHL